MLIAADCDVNKTTEDGTPGATAMHIAALNGDTTMLNALVAAGCDVNQQADDGATPVFVAALRGHSLNVFIAAGCDVNLADQNGVLCTLPRRRATVRLSER